MKPYLLLAHPKNGIKIIPKALANTPGMETNVFGTLARCSMGSKYNSSKLMKDSKATITIQSWNVLILENVVLLICLHTPAG